MFLGYKRWFFIATILFGGGLGLGLATPPIVVELMAEEMAAFEQLADFLAPLPKPSVFAFIYIKNVSALMISFAFSPILCLAPVMALTVNGWFIGLVSTLVIQEKSLGYLLAGLLPHGIFELPAFILGEAVALSFGTTVILALFKGEMRKQLLPNLRRSIRYLVIAFILLLPAAVIETYVTPLLLG